MYGLTDDIITVVIDEPIWRERTRNASLLVIHTLFSPEQSS